MNMEETCYRMPIYWYKQHDILLAHTSPIHSLTTPLPHLPESVNPMVDLSQDADIKIPLKDNRGVGRTTSAEQYLLHGWLHLQPSNK